MKFPLAMRSVGLRGVEVATISSDTPYPGEVNTPSQREVRFSARLGARNRVRNLVRSFLSNARFLAPLIDGGKRKTDPESTGRERAESVVQRAVARRFSRCTFSVKVHRERRSSASWSLDFRGRSKWTDRMIIWEQLGSW